MSITSIDAAIFAASSLNDQFTNARIITLQESLRHFAYVRAIPKIAAKYPKWPYVDNARYSRFITNIQLDILRNLTFSQRRIHQSVSKQLDESLLITVDEHAGDMTDTALDLLSKYNITGPYTQYIGNKIVVTPQQIQQQIELLESGIE